MPNLDALSQTSLALAQDYGVQNLLPYTYITALKINSWPISSVGNFIQICPQLFELTCIDA